MNDKISMDALMEGQAAVVRRIDTAGGMRRRFMDIGLIEGTGVTCMQKSPARDSAAYRIRGAVIALRAEDATGVLVQPC